jgi:NAD(P)-dependent dehydrogenase (short-subunit alcohol dehydrogenase family)
MADKKLNGRVAVITGASRGLGRAMALAVAEAGARVALVSRDEEKLNAVAHEIHASGGQAEAFKADVADEASVAALERAVSLRMGKVQILINNAGVNVRKSITDFTLDEWNFVIGTNMTAAFLMCRSFVPHMKGSGYGRILNMTSTMSHVSLPGRAAYSGSKAGLLGMTRSIALELAPEGITVNGISPGPFATDMNTAITENPDVNAAFIANVPLGRWGKVEDVGRLAVYLCSDEASFITGTDILIDGGWCAK